MNSHISKYLHFGYLPVHTREYPFRVDEITVTEPGRLPEDIEKRAFQIFKKAIKKRIPENRIMVPLSGGVDSRLILAELIRQTVRENIRTATFGVPGNLDVELARKVASAFGIYHQSIDLRRVLVSENELVDFAGNMQNPSNLLEAFWSHSASKLADSDETIFSGFIGDRITGSVPEQYRKIKSFEEAKTVFVHQNRADTSGFLPQINPDELEITDDGYNFLAPYEKLDYRIRQVNMTAPIVLGNYPNIQKPLIDPELVSLFYSVESRFRKNQSLFFRMVSRFYPDIFAIGIKNCFGAPLQSGEVRKALLRKWMYARRIANRTFPALGINDRLHNYVDPYWFFVKNKPTAQLVEKTMGDLSKRSLLDFNPVFALQKVQKGDMKLKNALEVLFNLEIYLKAGVFT